MRTIRLGTRLKKQRYVDLHGFVATLSYPALLCRSAGFQRRLARASWPAKWSSASNRSISSYLAACLMNFADLSWTDIGRFARLVASCSQNEKERKREFQFVRQRHVFSSNQIKLVTIAPKASQVIGSIWAASERKRRRFTCLHYLYTLVSSKAPKWGCLQATEQATIHPKSNIVLSLASSPKIEFKLVFFTCVVFCLQGIVFRVVKNWGFSLPATGTQRWNGIQIDIDEGDCSHGILIINCRRAR